MPAVLTATTDSSGPGDLLFVVVPIAVIMGAVYVGAAKSRARSRREHADIATSGQGTWEGVIDQLDLSIFFPQIQVGMLKSMFLSEGIPVVLTLDSVGLQLRPKGRLMRRHADQAWSAPWADVLSARSCPVGFKTLGGKVSLVPLTDVVISAVGSSAQPFLEWWVLVDDPEDNSPPTLEEPAEDSDWLAYAQEELGPDWRPGTAQIRIRMSAADGLVPAVQRWARGKNPT